MRKYRELANLEYKHRLVGKVSKCLIHDISTPLSVLSGSLKLLDGSRLGSAETINVKKSASHSLTYLESVLDNSLLLLKEKDGIEEFSPDTVVEKVLCIVKSRVAKSSIKLKTNLSGEVKIKGNESFFARAVLNLLINAIEELEQNNKGIKKIEISSRSKRGFYVLCIKDNGRGIDKAVLENMEIGIVSTKNENHLGLGLYFVIEAVEVHFEGKLDIESKKDSYTTITIKIPTVF